MAPGLFYREVVVFPGDEVAVVGVVTGDLPPPELRATYRDGESVRTVSGGGGAVTIEPPWVGFAVATDPAAPRDES